MNLIGLINRLYDLSWYNGWGEALATVEKMRKGGGGNGLIIVLFNKDE